jgi:predicted DNA-binding protein
MTTDRTAERKALAKFIEEAIEKGATTVEDVHKSIANLPLKILEESELLRAPAKEVRRVQDHTIGAIYDLIRHINEQVGTLAAELLDQAAKRRGAIQWTSSRPSSGTPRSRRRAATSRTSRPRS